MSGNVTLLTNFTNAGIIDATGRAVFETVGDTKISNVASKFGLGSLYFDGTGDYMLSIQSGASYILSGDFTVEAWIYPNSVSNNYIVTFGNEAAGRYNIALSSGILTTNIYGSGSVSFSGTTMTTGQWYYIAVVRSGSTIRGYVNGTVSSTTDTNSATIGSGNLRVGSDSSGSATWNGYIDDLRITKYARTISVPTSAFLLK